MTTDWQTEILKKWDPRPFKVSDALRDRLAREFRGEVLYNEPMAKHTSVRVGGPADVFLKPSSLADLIWAIKTAREEDIPTFFLGAGSNTLVKDGGVRGFVITPSSALKVCRLEAESQETADVRAEAGVGITAFVNFCAGVSLTGMEALVGIPGTIGGAIAMNAGARGTEIKDIVREVTVLDDEWNEKKIPREKLDFSYRSLKIPRAQVILAGVFRLNKGNGEEIAARVKEYQKKRAESQPLNFPNLGSVFKNPQPQKKGEVVPTAGKLIEETGLKNIRVGGARISEKHANFIVNEKGATGKDIIVLINLIRDKVKEATGIVLEPELKIIGEDR